MNARQRAPRHDQAAIRGAREGRDGALDLAGVAHVDRAHLHPERRRHGLDGAELADPGGYGGIPKDCRSRHAWRDLLEQLQPFSARCCIRTVMKPVALPPGRARLSTKPAPTGSATIANTIGTVRVACSNGRHGRGARGQDDVRRERDQFRRVSANARRHRRAPSGCRSARCGRRSSPIAAAPAGTPRCGPAIPDRPRLRS